MARVKAGQRAALTSALEALFARRREAPGSYSVSDDLVVVSDSPSHLAWAVGHLGQGAGTPFAAAIGERYKRGAGWLIRRRRAAGHQAGRGRRRPADRVRRHGRHEVPVPRAAGAGGRGRERGHVRVRGRAKGMGSWLADAAPAARRSICRRTRCSPVTSRCASRCSCSRSSPRRLATVGAGLSTCHGDAGREARRRASSRT